MTELREAAPSAGTDLLDERTRELADYCAAMTGRLRVIGQRLDRDPDAITEFLHEPQVRFPVQGMLPPQYRSAGEFPAPLVAASSTVLGQVVATEQVAYGDPNVILASPGRRSPAEWSRRSPTSSNGSATSAGWLPLPPTPSSP
ncbi:hypothetical protein Jiend_53450 [Micromonospora endophytica]|uniref:hypothetical protein n=1 Tax=Micromonospora endophytica TaxID=515350 RepID=UPI001BB38299|nr:hypothetical protein [Micromonospora endophytica]BCJ61923.1 hypothetical protein Jiend_53450 [Micromonospora endophytica]